MINVTSFALTIQASTVSADVKMTSVIHVHQDKTFRMKMVQGAVPFNADRRVRNNVTSIQTDITIANASPLLGESSVLHVPVLQQCTFQQAVPHAHTYQLHVFKQALIHVLATKAKTANVYMSMKAMSVTYAQQVKFLRIKPVLNVLTQLLHVHQVRQYSG